MVYDGAYSEGWQWARRYKDSSSNEKASGNAAAKQSVSIDINNLVLQPNEVTQVKWCTKEEILELIENDKVPRGYAYILNKYIN